MPPHHPICVAFLPQNIFTVLPLFTTPPLLKNNLATPPLKYFSYLNNHCHPTPINVCDPTPKIFCHPLHPNFLSLVFSLTSFSCALCFVRAKKSRQVCIPVGRILPATMAARVFCRGRGVSGGGVSVWGGDLCPAGSLSGGGLCLGGLCLGSLSGVSVQRGLCLEGSLSRGVSIRGALSSGVSVWGVSVWWVSAQKETPSPL